MTPNDALRFLATLGMETAEDLGRARKPAMQEALLARIEQASGVLRTALNDRPAPAGDSPVEGRPDGDPPA